MNSLASPLSTTLPPPRRDRTVAVDLAMSLLLGLSATALIFTGIALFQGPRLAQSADDWDDLGSAVLPLDLPPPPTSAARSDEPDLGIPTNALEPAPAKSEVSVAPSPALPELVAPAELAPRPAAAIALHLPGSFRPKGQMSLGNEHVFQRFEVDQVGQVLYENSPHVSRSEMGNATVLRLTLIWIVEPDGSVSNVRVGTSSGNEKVDELMADMIRQAVFSPAMKNGRKVRMMTSQQITVRWSGEAGLPRMI